MDLSLPPPMGPGGDMGGDFGGDMSLPPPTVGNIVLVDEYLELFHV